MADWISGGGVTLILLAYLADSLGYVQKNNTSYWLINLVGSLLAAIGAWLIHSIPFVILESVWAITSLYGLYKNLKN
ncbi:MAG: hypothetical protein OHK0038_12600 [Flammeovirgaceae bacterium]